MRFLVFLAASGLASPTFAQELVTLQTRPGVSQSFFVASMGERKPRAVALLLAGGGGTVRLRMEDGQVRFNQGNFLPRARREFIRNGVLPVIVDAPTDQHAGEGMSDAFRESEAHVTDIRAVRAEIARRYPQLPVFIVGTSRSTLSAAHLARTIGAAGLDGAVLTSSLFYSGTGPRARQALAGYDWQRISIPLLFVHHEDDGCAATPYRDAKRLAARYDLITVRGGNPPQSGPCDPFSNHGYLGREAETVEAIAAWMLGKPFSREIP